MSGTQAAWVKALSPERAPSSLQVAGKPRPRRRVPRSLQASTWDRHPKAPATAAPKPPAHFWRADRRRWQGRRERGLHSQPSDRGRRQRRRAAVQKWVGGQRVPHALAAEGHRSPRRALMATGGDARRLRKRGGGPGVEDVENPPISTAPGPHPIATLRCLARGRTALPVVMRRASMRWRVSPPSRSSAPCRRTEDASRRTRRSSTRQVLRIERCRCCDEHAIERLRAATILPIQALTFGKANN